MSDMDMIHALAQAYQASLDIRDTREGAAACRALAGVVASYRPPIPAIPVELAPYPAGYEEMRDRVASDRRILVYCGASDGLPWEPCVNVRLRTWHDLRHHLSDGGCDFGLWGEREAWRRASAEHPGLAWLLFSEIVGQAAVFRVCGYFGPQKIVRVPEGTLERWR